MPDPKRYDEFVGLLQKGTGSILAYINALLLNWADAEDVFQEVCATLWNKFDEFTPGSNFLAWALRVAQFKAMDFQKSRNRREAVWKSNVQLAMIPQFVEHEEETGGEDLVFLAQCIEKLAQGDRQLVAMCYGDGVAVRQLAEQLGRSPQSVHNSLHRIRQTLLECMKRLAAREEQR